MERKFDLDIIETSDDSDVAYANGHPIYLSDDASCLDAEEK